VGTNAPVNEALRPGRGKLTFEKVSEAWQAPGWNHVLEFEDRFLLEGNAVTQAVARTITRPDIVFSAGELGLYPGGLRPIPFKLSTPNFRRANGISERAGPGILESGVQIKFGTLGWTNGNSAPQMYDGFLMQRWGSFDGTTNAPIVFPVTTFWLPTLAVEIEGANDREVRWTVHGKTAGKVRIQNSENLQVWTDLEEITLAADSHTFTTTVDGARFLRVVKLD
jgi:hypothetical protein